MGVAPLRQAVGGPPGGLSREAPAGGRDAFIVMAREAQARTEQVEAVLRHQLAEEAARNAQRRFSAVQAEQAEQAELRSRERALAKATLDVTGDLVERAAAIRGEAQQLKTAQDADIQAIRSASAAAKDASGRYWANGAQLANLKLPSESCQELRDHLVSLAAAVPQVRAEAETALNATRGWVELACPYPKAAEAEGAGDKAYADARQVGELLNTLGADARLVADLGARLTECSANAKVFNESIQRIRVSLDEVDGAAERAMAQAAEARGRVETPVSQCATLLRRMDALLAGARATAGDRAGAVVGHQTYLVDLCSQLDATAKSAAAEADAVESAGGEVRANVEVSLRSVTAERGAEPYPVDDLKASIAQATVAVTAMQIEAVQNAGRVIKCLSPEPVPVQPPESPEGGEPKAPDDQGESVPALVVSSTFTTTPAEPSPSSPAVAAQPPPLVGASKVAAATSPLVPAAAQPAADENPITQVYSLADGSTVEGQYRVLAVGREGTVVASVGFRDGSREILSGQPAHDACARLGYYVRVPGIAGWVRSGLAFARDPRAPDVAAAPPPAPPPAAAPPPSDGGSILEGPLNYLACISRAGDEGVWCNDACRGRDDYKACSQRCDDAYDEAMKRCKALEGR